MHRSIRSAPCRFAVLSLILAFALPQTAMPATRPGIGPANQPIEENQVVTDRRQARALPSLERGIRTYGVGASRIDRGPARVPGAFEQASIGQPPALLGVTRKISGTPMAGSVATFRVSPNGVTVVFIADKDTAGRFELYSAPANGSAAPVKLSAGLPFGSGDIGVSDFQISPDSLKVVFLADANTGGGFNEIFSAPINASAAPVRLNTAAMAPVTSFGITPDSARAVFFGTDTATASGAVELFAATIGTASSAVQLSDVGLGNALGDVVAADFSPNSARVVYAADGTANEVFQWYSVPINALGPGSDVQLSAALSSVGLVRVSPDSSRVVYTSDDNVFQRMEVFSKPLAGGTRVQLNPSMVGDGATAIEISPDGARVGYLADQNTAGVNEVYSAQILVASSGTRLNTPMSGSQYTDTLSISPDSTTVVYVADQNTPGTYEVYGAPLNAGAGPTLLHDLTSPNTAGYFQGLGAPIIGRRAVYPVFGFGAAVDLFSVPYDASASFIRVNDPLPAGQVLFDSFLPYAARRLMAYGFGPSTDTATRTIVSGPIRSDLPVEQINVTSGAAAIGVLGYEISSDERYGIYLQDQDTAGKPELYSRELDSDADTVINAADNCPFIANPTQQPVVFPATVLALSTTTFSWSTPLDVRFVRGPLSSVRTYGIDRSGTLVEATGYTDTSAPAGGAGFWYLFAPDCPGRSYQTVLGAEPARDLAAFP